MQRLLIAKASLGSDQTVVREPRPGHRQHHPSERCVQATVAVADAGEREWKSELLPACRRLSRRAELLIADVYLAGVKHSPGASGPSVAVRRPHRQGRGQPRVAQDPRGVGGLAAARSG